MKKSELQEIIRGIIKQTLNEFLNIETPPKAELDAQSQIDPTQPHPDDQSPADMMKQKRDLEKQRHDKLKQTDMDLKITKDQTKYFDSQLKKNKVDVGNKQKELQQLKGARI
jgi:hypothetical protein